MSKSKPKEPSTPPAPKREPERTIMGGREVSSSTKGADGVWENVINLSPDEQRAYDTGTQQFANLLEQVAPAIAVNDEQRQAGPELVTIVTGAAGTDRQIRSARFLHLGDRDARHAQDGVDRQGADLSADQAVRGGPGLHQGTGREDVPGEGSGKARAGRADRGHLRCRDLRKDAHGFGRSGDPRRGGPRR